MSERILTDLPLEIFWLIVKGPEFNKDIKALTQVNRGLYALLNPYLYRINVENYDNPAIAWGAYHGQEETVRKALKQGARTWSTYGEGSLPEPITIAALRGHANIVKLLLDHGVDPMSSWPNDDDGKETGLRMARFRMDFDNYTELYPIRDWPPWTAALAKDNAEVLQVLIEKSGFVPRPWDFFETVSEGYYETLKVLVKACPKWEDLARSNYSTILGKAISVSPQNLDITRFLVDSGSPINHIDYNQQTPLAAAAEIGNIETVRFLLDRGAHPDPETPLWPLRLAAEQGNTKIAELLLEKIDVQSKITGGRDDQFWLLYSAAACGFEKIVRACLDAGCNPNNRLYIDYCPFSVDATNQVSDGGYNLTPLEWARGRGHFEVMRLLENVGSSNRAKIADSTAS
ncbi:hypothetical protein LT330_009845 [Penicillium expansum]|nr:hypothetical protein LT330_009845 [Penicillium expansum]